MMNIFAPTPETSPSLRNSMAGATTALAKPVMGTSVPAPGLGGQLLVPAHCCGKGRQADERGARQCASVGKCEAQGRIQHAQALAQKADGAAHEKRPQAVLQKRRGRRRGLAHLVVFFCVPVSFFCRSFCENYLRRPFSYCPQSLVGCVPAREGIGSYGSGKSVCRRGAEYVRANAKKRRDALRHIPPCFAEKSGAPLPEKGSGAPVGLI